MEIAQRRNAVLSDKFYFRKQVFAPRHRNNNHHHHHHNTPDSLHASPTPSRTHTPRPIEPGPVEDEYTLMTVDEIINGQSSSDGFPGLIPLIESYLNSINVDVQTRCELAQYLELVRKRANGTWETAATWMRKFVRGHPAYEMDSRINPAVNYDLVKAAEVLGNGGGKGTELWKGLFEARESKV